MRELLQVRERLDALLQQRLGEAPSPAPSAARPERLARLEAQVARMPSPHLAPGEVRWIEGPTSPPEIPRTYRLVSPAVILLVGSFVVSFRTTMFLVIGMDVLLRLLDVVQRWHHRARYWLTPERLAWEPVNAEPVHIPLRTLTPGGVSQRLEFYQTHLRVEGAHATLSLPLERDANWKLLTALELLHRPPLLGRAAPEPLADVVCYPAVLRDGDTRKGCAILRPGSVSFLPREHAWKVIEAVTGAPWNHQRAPQAVDLSRVLEHLRHLPTEAEFDACIERAVAQVGGVRWSPSACRRHEAHLPLWKRLHFKSLDGPATSLSGAVDPRAVDTAERLLAAWPQR